MGCLLIFRKDVLVDIKPSFITRCQVIVQECQVVINQYDPYNREVENTQVSGLYPLNLSNRHYYLMVSATQAYYLYVDLQGNVLEFDSPECFAIAKMRNDPSLGKGHPPVIGVRAVRSSNPQRPTRFERILRENEVWEEYRPPPRPIPETRRTEVTEEDLAAIFDKPKKLIAQAPNPMDIDIIKCMEEVIGKTS